MAPDNVKLGENAENSNKTTNIGGDSHSESTDPGFSSEELHKSDGMSEGLTQETGPASRKAFSESTDPGFSFEELRKSDGVSEPIAEREDLTAKVAGVVTGEEVNDEDAIVTTVASKLGVKEDAVRGVMDVVSTLSASDNHHANVKMASRHFREEAEKHGNSVFLNAAYAICTLLEQYFDFSISATDYSGVIGELYPEEKFEEKDLEKILKKRKLMGYVLAYKEAKDSKDPDVKNAARKVLMAALIKEDLWDIFKAKTESYFYEDLDRELDLALDSTLDKIADKIYNSYTEQLPAHVVDQLEKSDTKISAYYVNRELLALGMPELLRPGSDDPEKLYARLMQSTYTDNSVKKSAFGLVTDFDEFVRQATTPGAIAFFHVKTPSGKLETICGIVGLDGKFRVNTSTGLHAFPDFGPEMAKVLNSKEFAGTPIADESVGSFFTGMHSVVSGMFPGYKFRGAFIPESSEISTTTEEKKDGVDKSTDEAGK